MYYAGFSIICDGVAEFPNRQALDKWLRHDTELDRWLNREAMKHENSPVWDAAMGQRVEFTPAQVHRMFGGSDFSGQTYQSIEPATGPNVMWHYL